MDANHKQNRKDHLKKASQDTAIPSVSLRYIVLILLGGLGVIFALYKMLDLIPLEMMEPRFTPARKVGLDEPGRHSHSGPLKNNNKLPLRVAIAPVISPEKSLVLYQGLVDYLGRALGREAVMIQRQSYSEINDLVQYGQCDVAFVCTYAFVLGEQEFGMEILVVPQVAGKITYQSYIIVPASSDAGSLLDLRGKSFASADLISNTGWLFPAYWLRTRGEEPEKFFATHLITGSHDRSIEAVISGYVSGAAVDSMVYEQMAEENPEVLSKTKIILKSPRFGNPPIVVHPRIDPVLRQQLKEVLLNLHKDPEGRKALAPLKIEKFIEPDDRLYDEIRKMAELQESAR